MAERKKLPVDQRAALKMQAMHRGNLSRSGRLKVGKGPPYTAAQQRRLEDALSVAVNTAMGLTDPKARLVHTARHIAAAEHGRPPPDAPPRVGKLTEAQQAELADLMQAVFLAVNACNTMHGTPLRNVAEHLFAQHQAKRNADAGPQGDVRGLARRLGMRGGAARHESMKFTNLPKPPTPREVQQAEERRIEAEQQDPITVAAKQAANAAFVKYDQKGLGELQKADLFTILLDMGQVPGLTKQQKEIYLDKEFAKADQDGSGTVDFDEFVDFYVQIVQADEAEKAARDAFKRFDSSNDNALEKRELFQVLLEAGLVTGDTKLEKERNLEEQFAKADTDGSGSVDFAEFVAFYIIMRKQMWGADLKHRKETLARKRAQRKTVSETFVVVDSVFELLRAGHVRLLSARWWLQRAGFDRTEIERSGRKVGRWVKRRGVTPLPCRQLLEREAPEAYLNIDQLEAFQQRFREAVTATKGAEKDGINAVPVVAASHCWHAPGNADPHGATMLLIAEELARQMPTYEAWGFADVGVFFDWSSIFQDTVDTMRSAEQERAYKAAIPQMALLFSHRLTTVFLIVQPNVEPPRGTRGWPYYEEALVRLFKEAPPPKRYRLPEAGPTNMWSKVHYVGTEDEAASFKAQAPPLAPSRFISESASKVFTCEADRALVLADYRRTVEAGFAGLEKLSLARRGWGDADLEELAAVIKEIECPQVRELDLQANDFTARGLEAIGQSVISGALHSLETLNVSDCSGLLSLPESLAELHMLQTLKLDGCIGLSSLPQSFGKMASLKTLSATHCLKLMNNPDALKLLPATVTVVKEKKEKKEKKDKDKA